MKSKRITQQVIDSILITIFLIGCSIQSGNSSSSETPGVTPMLIATTASTVVAAPQVTLNDKFDVNGHSLIIKCLGSGTPTIVLEPGEGGTHFAMEELQGKLAAQTTTCAYDRAKTGGLRTAREIVDDLHALLAAANLSGPFVLVGSSAGGNFVQLYARTYPDQVAGVVAMNPVPPAHPWLDEVKQIFTAQEYADEQAYFNGKNGESFDYLSSDAQLASAAKPPQIPFEMLLSTDVQCEGDNVCLKSYPLYEQIMKDVTGAWPHGNFSQVAAGHEIYQNDIEAVTEAVRRVLGSK
jgi:pimeloyl-ACP methyl ester carboxylesterase